MAMPKTCRIEIQHMDCAAWITTNNTYTAMPSAWGPKNLWQGVLFQFGDYLSMTGAVLDAFDGVELRKGSSVVRAIARAQFAADCIWINVVAKKDTAQNDPPMDNTHLLKLLIDPAKKRSIRNFFTPLAGGMTFWHGKQGYSISVKPSDDHPEHDKYTFTFSRRTGGYVTVYDSNGQTKYSLGSTVSKIVVLFKGHPQGQHGNQSNPPQFP